MREADNLGLALKPGQESGRRQRTLQVWSRLAVSTQLPFWFHCVCMMVPLCPCSVARQRPDLGHHSLTRASLEPAATGRDGHRQHLDLV